MYNIIKRTRSMHALHSSCGQELSATPVWEGEEGEEEATGN